MGYCEVPPGSQAGAAVRCFVRLAPDPIPGRARRAWPYLQLPDTGVTLLCALRQGRAEGVWVLGASPRGRRRRLPAETQLLGVRLFGVAGARLLDVDPADLLGRRMNFARQDLGRAAAFARASEAVRWPDTEPYDALLADWSRACRPGDRRLERLAQRLKPPCAVSLPELAAAEGLTDRHLRRLFPLAVGRSPKGYAATEALRYACERFADPGGTWTAAAAAAGFHDLAHLNRAVTAAFGRPPREVGRDIRALAPKFLDGRGSAPGVGLSGPALGR